MRSAARASCFRVLAVAALLLGVPGLVAPSGAAAGVGDVPAATPLAYHANLASNETSPTGTLGVGSEVAVDYSLAAPTAGPSSRIQVYVPPTVMVLPTTSGGVHLYLTSTSVALSGRNATVVPDGPAARQTSPSMFSPNATASLSSLGLAVMAGGGTGAPTLEFSWRWAITAPDGGTSFGPWAAPQTVVPAAMTLLAGAPGHSLSLGTPYQICLTGSLAGRTFSVRLGTADPVASYDLGESSVPAGANDSACLSVTFAGPIATPQPAVVHLWEVTNTSFLLYSVDVQLLDPPGPTGPNGGPGGGVSGLVLGAGVAGAVLLVVIVVLVRRRGARPTLAEAPDPPPAAPTAPVDPAAVPPGPPAPEPPAAAQAARIPG